MSGVNALSPTDEFLRAASEAHIEFEPGELEQLGRYLAILLDANTRMNLTRITDPAAAWMRHIFDSLTLLPFIAQAEARRVVDVGSGGGAPGIPLAITLPHVQFSLLEATGKKANYLEATAKELGLRNVRVIGERAELAGAKDSEWREHFDVAIARALGPLNVLLELALPLVTVNGHLLAIKGERADAEVMEAKKALHQLHAEVVDIHPTPTGRIVVVEKRRATPAKYPRQPGEPKRAPL